MSNCEIFFFFFLLLFPFFLRFYARQEAITIKSKMLKYLGRIFWWCCLRPLKYNSYSPWKQKKYSLLTRVPGLPHYLTRDLKEETLLQYVLGTDTIQNSIGSKNGTSINFILLEYGICNLVFQHVNIFELERNRDWYKTILKTNVDKLSTTIICEFHLNR